MQKQKPLLPSLREKKRYVAFEVIPKKRLTAAKIAKTIQLALLQYTGIKGAAKAGVMFLTDKYNPETQKGLVKVSHDAVDDLKAALAFIDKVDDEKVIVQTLGVSGILKKAEKKFIAG